MRTVLAVYLALLLMLCPVLCGAAELGEGPHGHGVAGSPAPDGQAPDGCPEEGDNCICQGAVPSHELRPSDWASPGLARLLAIPVPTPLHPVAHLTRDGSPTGLAGRGTSVTIRAWLQNFRC